MLDLAGGHVGRLWLPHALLAPAPDSLKRGPGDASLESAFNAGGVAPAAPKNQAPWRGEASLGALASALRPGRRLDCVALAQDAGGRWDLAAAGGAFAESLRRRSEEDAGPLWDLPEGGGIWAQVVRVDATRGALLRVAPGVVGLAALSDVADVPHQGLGAALARELRSGVLVPCVPLGRAFSSGRKAAKTAAEGPRPALAQQQLALSLRESRLGGGGCPPPRRGRGASKGRPRLVGGGRGALPATPQGGCGRGRTIRPWG